MAFREDDPDYLLVGNDGGVESTAPGWSRSINAFPAVIFYAGLGSMVGLLLSRRRRAAPAPHR